MHMLKSFVSFQSLTPLTYLTTSIFFHIYSDRIERSPVSPSFQTEAFVSYQRGRGENLVKACKTTPSAVVAWTKDKGRGIGNFGVMEIVSVLIIVVTSYLSKPSNLNVFKRAPITAHKLQLNKVD